MSGKPPPQPPMLGPAQARTLLDQVIYEQVIECIDLDALGRLEQSLLMMVGEIEGVGPDKAGEMATAMLDRALSRVPADVRSYLRLAGLLSTSGCELCDEEMRPSAPAPRPSPVRLSCRRGARGGRRSRRRRWCSCLRSRTSRRARATLPTRPLADF